MMLRIIETGVFLPTLITVLILSIAIATFCQEHTIRRIILVWILACLFRMFYSTVLGRTPREDVNFQLTPFWSIGAIQDGYIETLYEKIYNVIFFVPYGLLLGLYFKKHPVRYSLFVGCITSIGIELLQFITRTGTCETDDVICNTLGCGIGLIIAIGCMKLFKRVKIDNND